MTDSKSIETKGDFMDEISEIVGQLAGAASMCWIPKPTTNVFDSEQASKFVEQATAQLNRLLEEARASELADYLSKRKISDTEQEVLQWAEERLAELKKDKI